MIDLTGKYIKTNSNAESAQLLKMAMAQGFKFAVGEKILESERLFHFHGSPYKIVNTPSSPIPSDNITHYADLFGDEKEGLGRIVDLAMRWCREHGYDHVAVYANCDDEEYTGQAMANSLSGARQDYKAKLKKPVKVSVKDIEDKFGYPIEIVS